MRNREEATDRDKNGMKVKLVIRSLAKALICLASSLEMRAQAIQSVFLVHVGGTGNN